MINKENLVNEVMTLDFNKTEAIEIVNIIIEKEGENINNIVELWESWGARWSEDEVLKYVNMGFEEKASLDDILSWDCFYKLSSSLIVSWRY